MKSVPKGTNCQPPSNRISNRDKGKAAQCARPSESSSQVGKIIPVSFLSTHA